MHRAPVSPANTKLLKKSWDQATYNIHRHKVHDAAAVIDNKPPQSKEFLTQKKKLAQTYVHMQVKWVFCKGVSPKLIFAIFNKKISIIINLDL